MNSQCTCLIKLEVLGDGDVITVQKSISVVQL